VGVGRERPHVLFRVALNEALDDPTSGHGVRLGSDPVQEEGFKLHGVPPHIEGAIGIAHQDVTTSRCPDIGAAAVVTDDHLGTVVPLLQDRRNERDSRKYGGDYEGMDEIARNAASPLSP